MKALSEKRASSTTEVKVGNVTVKIYRSTTRGRNLYTLVYRGTNNSRVKKSFADFSAAKLEAQKIATSIHNGELEVLKLTNSDRSAYARAQQFLRPFGQSIDMAAQEYAEARKVLGESGTLLEAAGFYAKHHGGKLQTRNADDVAAEMLASKKADGMSDRYISDLKSRLKIFTGAFRGPIAEISCTQLQDWLNGLGLAHRGRNNFRAILISLFNFAKTRGLLAKNQPTEADSLTKAKGNETPIGIFTPAEMTLLLQNADETLVPYLAIGAFAGLRTAELQRLEWSEIKLDQGHIEVAASKAKTAQRRLVPISDNLALWIKTYLKTKGMVCELSTINQKASDFARRLELKWPHNGLRHSFASYRLAKCKNAGEVALEMGNSPQIVFRHYRELVTAVDAQRWWSISPV